MAHSQTDALVATMRAESDGCGGSISKVDHLLSTILPCINRMSEWDRHIPVKASYSSAK